MTKTLKILLIILGVIVVGGLVFLVFQNLAPMKIKKTITNEEIEKDKEFIAWEKGKRIVIPVEDFDNFENVILHYLNEYPNNEEILEDLFFNFYYNEKKFAEENEWAEVPEGESEDFIKKLVRWAGRADIRGEGKEELVIIFTDTREFYSYNNPIFGVLERLAIFSYDENKYKLELLSESDFFWDFYLMDVNNNGKRDIVTVRYSCGMHTCFNQVIVIHSMEGKWENLIDTPMHSFGTADIIFAEQKNNNIEWIDLNGDGTKELVITGGGVVATIGGGMGRPITSIYAFNKEENKYVLVEEKKKPVDHIYYLMVDANYALQKENFGEALRLSLRAINQPDPYLGDSSGASSLDEKHIARILSYAATQAILTYLSQDPPNIKSANNLFQEIKDKYDRKDNPYVDAASVLLEIYSQKGDVTEACREMEENIILNKENADFFEWHGYVTEKLELSEMCPLN